MEPPAVSEQEQGPPGTPVLGLRPWGGTAPWRGPYGQELLTPAVPCCLGFGLFNSGPAGMRSADGLPPTLSSCVLTGSWLESEPPPLGHSPLRSLPYRNLLHGGSGSEHEQYRLCDYVDTVDLFE